MFLRLAARRIHTAFTPVHPLLLRRAEMLAAEFAATEKAVASGAFDHETSVRFSNLSAVMEALARYREDADSARTLAQMVAEESDAELVADAQGELDGLLPQLQRCAQQLEKRLLPPIVHSERPAILELRPGVGGSEAALFTQDLVGMYLAFAHHMRWPAEIMSVSTSASGAVTEAIVAVNAPGAYNMLRHESGVHRVQRIPATEAKGRIHTSTAAVVVLPKMSEGTERSLSEDERTFAPGEVRIDTMRAGGKGGQHVNTTDSAVRLVHLPTGITVMQQDERSQPKNKAKAFSILRARLAHAEREKELAEQRSLRTAQVSTTDRSDKIRTYNYPQNRVTDHRCGHSVHDVPAFMAGTRMAEMVDKLEEHEFEARLQALIADCK